MAVRIYLTLGTRNIQIVEALLNTLGYPMLPIHMVQTQNNEQSL